MLNNRPELHRATIDPMGRSAASRTHHLAGCPIESRRHARSYLLLAPLAIAIASAACDDSQVNGRADAAPDIAQTTPVTDATTAAGPLPDTVASTASPAQATDTGPEAVASNTKAATPIFEATTGITERRYGGGGVVTQTGVRTGKQEGFDRIVFEFSGARLPGYHIEYVDGPVRHCGSGAIARVEGARRLLIRMMPARAHDDAGNATFAQQAPAPGLEVIRSARVICDFEAQIEWAIGVTHARGYRVLELREPTRLVVDLLH